MTHLKTISQAFALLKAYKLYQDISVSRNPSRAEKLIERPVVTTQDVISAAPFLFYSKMNMNRVWIQKHYQGNKWAATQSVMRIAEKRFKKFVSSFDKEMIRKFYDSESLTKVEHEQFVDYAKTHDTWAYKIG